MPEEHELSRPKDSGVKVFRPRTMSGLLRLYGKNPEALIFAGGTQIVLASTRGEDRSIRLPAKIIYLTNVADLLRISRSQRYLDMGACLPIARILSLGRHLLPDLLSRCLRSIGTPSVRNMATLGGNVCAPAPFHDSLPALDAIDAQLELRSQSGTRWLRVRQFSSTRPGEILARVRLPLQEVDFQIYRKVGERGCPAILSFAGTASMTKGNLETLRFAIGGVAELVYRNPEVEARLEGLKLPIPVKEIEMQEAALGRSLEQVPSYRRNTAVRLLGWFLRNLNQKSLEIP